MAKHAMSLNAVAILSLKGALLSYLERFLFSEYEAKESIFIKFLHNREIQDYFSPDVGMNSRFIKRINWQKIPLQKRQNGFSVLYISTLPQILTKKCDSADLSILLRISQQLANRLNQVQFDELNSELDHNFSHLIFLSQLWPEFKIETQRPGQLAFYLSEAGIARWLQQVKESPICQQSDRNFQPPLNRISLDQPSPNQTSFDQISSRSLSNQLSKYIATPDQDHTEANIKSPSDGHIQSLCDPHLQPDPYLNSSQKTSLEAAHLLNITPAKTDNLLWQMQYLYARCCTLLSLWRQACSQEAVSAAPTWLTADSRLRLHSPEDWQMIQLLIEITDHLFWIPYQWKRQQYLLLFKLVARLYQSFDQFHGACLSGFSQISSAKSSSNRPLFQARFDLVEITKNVLKALLCGYLGVKAQTSL